jgi:hypothetical protein
VGTEVREGTYIHDIVEYYERSPFCFWFDSDAYLSDASVAASVLARDLIVQILDAEYSMQSALGGSLACKEIH